MGKVKAILKVKGHTVFSVAPTIMVYQAIELMCEKNIGALLIEEDGSPVGIFTERDYARKLILQGKSSKDTPLSELMTRNVISITPDNTVEECLHLMSDKRIRHLPVIENNKIVGMISIGDLVKYIIEEQKSIIEHLEHYITNH